MKSLRAAVLLLSLSPVLSLACDKTVSVPNEMRACKSAKECVEIDTRCDACCGSEAINREPLRGFAELRGATCGGHSGSVCDCAPPPGHVQCLRAKCTRVATLPKK